MEADAHGLTAEISRAAGRRAADGAGPGIFRRAVWPALPQDEGGPLPSCVLPSRSSPQTNRLVIDGDGLANHLYHQHDGLDWVHGGQYQQYQHRTCDFLRTIAGAGLQMCVVFGGPPATQHELEAQLKTTRQQLRLVHKICTAESAASTASGIAASDRPAPLLLRQVLHAVLRAAAVPTAVLASSTATAAALRAVATQCHAFVIADAACDLWLATELPHGFVPFRELHVAGGTVDAYHATAAALADAIQVPVAVLPLLKPLLGKEQVLRPLHARARQQLDAANGVPAGGRRVQRASSGTVAAAMIAWLQSVCLEVATADGEDTGANMLALRESSDWPSTSTTARWDQLWREHDTSVQDHVVEAAVRVVQASAAARWIANNFARSNTAQDDGLEVEALLRAAITADESTPDSALPIFEPQLGWGAASEEEAAPTGDVSCSASARLSAHRLRLGPFGRLCTSDGYCDGRLSLPVTCCFGLQVEDTGSASTWEVCRRQIDAVYAVVRPGHSLGTVDEYCRDRQSFTLNRVDTNHNRAAALRIRLAAASCGSRGDRLCSFLWVAGTDPAGLLTLFAAEQGVGATGLDRLVSRVEAGQGDAVVAAAAFCAFVRGISAASGRSKVRSLLYIVAAFAARAVASCQCVGPPMGPPVSAESEPSPDVVPVCPMVCPESEDASPGDGTTVDTGERVEALGVDRSGKGFEAGEALGAKSLRKMAVQFFGQWQCAVCVALQLNDALGDPAMSTGSVSADFFDGRLMHALYEHRQSTSIGSLLQVHLDSFFGL